MRYGIDGNQGAYKNLIVVLAPLCHLSRRLVIPEKSKPPQLRIHLLELGGGAELQQLLKCSPLLSQKNWFLRDHSQIRMISQTVLNRLSTTVEGRPVLYPGHFFKKICLPTFLARKALLFVTGVAHCYRWRQSSHKILAPAPALAMGCLRHLSHFTPIGESLTPLLPPLPEAARQRNKPYAMADLCDNRFGMKDGKGISQKQGAIPKPCDSSTHIDEVSSIVELARE